MIGFRILKRARKVDARTVASFRDIPVANVSDSMHRMSAGGARLRERIFHSQSIGEILDQIDEYFTSMIERGVPPDLSRDPDEYKHQHARDPKTAEFTRLADSGV